MESPTYILRKGTTYEPDMLTNIVVASADATIAITNCTVVITKASAAALTMTTPSTAQNGTRIRFISTTAAAHTVTHGTVGFNGAGASGDVGTFGGAKGDGFECIAYGGVWYVLRATNVTFG